MGITGPKRTISVWLSKCPLAFAAILVAGTAAAAQTTTLRLDPEHTTVRYDLSDVLHAVHGTFQLKQGTLQLNSASGELSGEIVVDAKSGESGTAMRDRKMHREVLESDRYPEITFHPDHIDGVVSQQGKSSVQVHGTFTIHGADHELTAPAEVEMAPNYWTATVHFSVPYVQWGMKNPSSLFLRVSSSVDIVLTATGSRSVASPERAEFSSPHYPSCACHTRSERVIVAQFFDPYDENEVTNRNLQVKSFVILRVLRGSLGSCCMVN